MNVINGLFQRLLFTGGLLLFMQLPQFIGHYSQHLAGYYQSQQRQLQQYQTIADLNFNGQLDLLIRDFQASSSLSVQQVASQIQHLQRDVPQLQQQLQLLSQGDYLQQLSFLSRHIDSDIALNTWQLFQPGLPLTRAALVTGLVGGITVNLCWLLLAALLRKLFVSKKAFVKLV